MSDCESEDYSCSEDEDYVPSGGEYSEDDINDLVKESGDDEDEEGSKKPSDVKSKKKSSKNYPARKQKKGVLILSSKEDGGENEVQDMAPGEAEDNNIFSELKQKKMAEAKKKREDDLWSSFLSDVGQKPKQPPLPSSSVNNQTPVEKPKVPLPDKETEKQKETSKMTITTVYDFAGEEVRVTKEVDSSSKEAKAFQKQQEKSQQEPSPISSKSSVLEDSGLKRPGGMSSILGKLGSKKQKISTLEKSKLDWESFKEKEGISEELAIHNRGKDGSRH
uniref:Craniofacial development protein 1 n=1 Tax=Xenopus tropicalis TaxID=8364 RepID=A0A803JTF9_XENTR